jgi:hypothetical protein
VWAIYRSSLGDGVKSLGATPKPRGRHVVQVTLGVLLILTLGAAAISASPAPLSPAVIPAPQTYGVRGQIFQMSFLQHPSRCWGNAGCGVIPASPFPRGVLDLRVWETDDVSVIVQTFDAPITKPAADFAFLTANSPILGLQKTYFEGYPALRGLVPCYVPAGTCSGYYGELDVVTPSSAFSVFINDLGKQSTARLLDSFRIVS